jgi:hypothetical protein
MGHKYCSSPQVVHKNILEYTNLSVYPYLYLTTYGKRHEANIKPLTVNLDEKNVKV